jgi:hypothetical protein
MRSSRWSSTRSGGSTWIPNIGTICVLMSAAVMQHVKSDKADKRKQTIERANSSKSEKLQEQARKNAEMEKKKAKNKNKNDTDDSSTRRERKKEGRKGRAANKRTEIEQNRIEREKNRLAKQQKR